MWPLDRNESFKRHLFFRNQKSYISPTINIYLKSEIQYKYQNKSMQQNSYVSCLSILKNLISTPPPPPHSSRLTGNYAYSLSRDIPYLGENWRTFYGLFHIISTPFWGTFPTWPLSCLWWPLFNFFPFISFLRAPEICVRILPYTLGGPTTDMQYNKGPFPFSREAI